MQRVLAKLEASGQIMTVTRIMANEPKLFRPFILVANALVYSEHLPADVREVVVLWIARSEEATYEWYEHVPMALRMGVTQEQVDLIDNGQVDANGFSEDQLLGVAVARAIMVDRELPNDLWQRSIDRWGVAGAIDLVMSVGWWGGITRMLLDALGLKVPDQGDHKIVSWGR